MTKYLVFHFTAKEMTFQRNILYDAGNGFEISKTDKTYKIEPGHYGFIGRPGGQMVHQNIFRLDTIYSDISLSATEDSYLLTYEFENDTVYNVSDRKKIFELNKTDFLPIQIKETSKQLGNKSVSIANFSDIRINDNVSRSINEIKQDFKDYTT